MTSFFLNLKRQFRMNDERIRSACPKRTLTQHKLRQVRQSVALAKPGLAAEGAEREAVMRQEEPHHSCCAVAPGSRGVADGFALAWTHQADLAASEVVPDADDLGPGAAGDHHHQLPVALDAGTANSTWRKGYLSECWPPGEKMR